MINKDPSENIAIPKLPKKIVGLKRITSLVGLMNLTYNLVRYEQLVRLHKVKVV